MLDSPVVTRTFAGMLSSLFSFMLDSHSDLFLCWPWTHGSWCLPGEKTKYLLSYSRLPSTQYGAFLATVFLKLKYWPLDYHVL